MRAHRLVTSGTLVVVMSCAEMFVSGLAGNRSAAAAAAAATEVGGQAGAGKWALAYVQDCTIRVKYLYAGITYMMVLAGPPVLPLIIYQQASRVQSEELSRPAKTGNRSAV